MLRLFATVLLVPIIAFIANERLLLINLDSYKGDFLERVRSLQRQTTSSSMASSASSAKLHVAPHEVPSPAFLYVTAEPGELATDDEFNDWYANEHVPIRLKHIPEFLTGARYVAADAGKPSYAALYETEHFKLFSEPKYTKLRGNRSPREADLVKRLETLDRRTGKIVADTGRRSWEARDTSTFITTYYVQPAQGKEDEYQQWYEATFVKMLKSAKGWRRTFSSEIVDSLVIGAKHDPQQNTSAKYLVVTEWDSEPSADAADAVKSAESISSVEVRQWKLLKAYDNTAKPRLDRLKPSYPAPGTSEIGDKIRLRRGKRGLTPLDGALMNAPEIANGWNTLLGAVRNKNSLPDDVRELMILRVAARNSAAYEWIHHEHVGRDGGLTTEQLSYLRDLSRRAPSPSAPAPFTPLQAAAFAFADASTRHAKVPNNVYNELKAELQKQLPKGVTIEQQLTEVAVTTGTYNMVSRFLVATNVDDHANVMTPFPSSNCQTRTLYIEDGVTLNVFLAKHDDAPNKPWIVFVNSLLTDYTMWEGVMARLSPHYNIVAYDQRGHGESSVPPRPCTIEDLSDDIAKILHQLQIPTPIKAVIGISQGGATTLSFAIRHQDKYEKIVVCDTQIKSPEANRKAWDDRIELASSKGMSALADATIPRWFPPFSSLVKGDKEHIIRPMIEGTRLEGFIAGARALQGYDLSDKISTALKGKKALLVAGEKDGKLPEGLKKLSEELSADGNDVDFFEVPNAGHLPVFQDNGLEEWLERVEKFLKE